MSKDDRPEASGERYVVDPASVEPAPATEAQQIEAVVDAFLATVQDGAPASEREAAEALAARVRLREGQFARLMRITERINRGITLDETLDFVYDELKEVIPYNRIGFSLIDADAGTVSLRWGRSDRAMKLAGSYTGQLKGSSLNEIIRRRLPRIINDLEAYLAQKPDSVPTQKLVAEGMRSSLTCPLLVDEKPVGFMFFTSAEKHTYTNVHVGFFQQIAAQLSTIVEKGHLYTELDAQKDIIQRQNDLLLREMEMARQVQRALIPDDAPEVAGLDIAFIYEPAIQVGGDILDVIRQADGRTMLFVGDAMGHGVSAALIMSVAKAALQSAADAETDPGKILNRVNGALARLFEFQFVTAACCVIDAPRRTAEVALAGHSPPVHFNARGEELLEDDEGGDMPLGIRRDVEYDTDRIALAAGDMLVFFTDGVFEAENASEEQYGMARLCEQVRVNGSGTSRQVLEAVRRDVKAHCGDRKMNDDLTLLAVKMTSE